MIRKRGGRVLVEKEGQRLLEIPLRDTDSIAVFGNVQITNQALSEFLDRGIPVALYTINGRLKGHLTPEASRNIPLRIHQYRTALDPAQALPFAKLLVRAKILNSANLVFSYRGHYAASQLDAAIARMKEHAGAIEAISDPTQLLGTEGAAAAIYFQAFAQINRSGLPFEGRVKHPARDPINGLLSLGYTMATNELRALAEGAGLEPHLGFLHRVDYGRPSLALDLVEPFRPVIDRLTLTLLNEHILRGEDFGRRLSGPEQGSVILTPDAWPRFLREYERCLTASRRSAPSGIRAAMQNQVESLTGALRDGRAFTPYREE